jgi:hypothetical protein
MSNREENFKGDPQVSVCIIGWLKVLSLKESDNPPEDQVVLFHVELDAG